MSERISRRASPWPLIQWQLRHHALHPPVDRTHHENVRTAVTGAPDADPLLIGLAQCLGEGDGVAVVTDLPPWIDFLPRLAIARAKVPVVIHQRRQPRGDECLREPVKEHLLYRGKAVCHDDRGDRPGASIRQIVPAAQHRAVLRLERDVSAHRPLLSSTLPQSPKDPIVCHPDRSPPAGTADRSGGAGLRLELPAPSAQPSSAPSGAGSWCADRRTMTTHAHGRRDAGAI